MTEPSRTSQAIYQGLFAESPNPYLVLTPKLVIVDSNNAFLAETDSSRDRLHCRFLFDAFPANPTDPDCLLGSTAAFERVLRHRQRDTIVQRYDLCLNGVWQTCHWLSVKWPIIDDGQIVAIIQYTRRMTPRDLNRLISESHKLRESATTLAQDLEQMIR